MSNNINKKNTLDILSWNVNGLRALEKKGQFDWLISQNIDIICLQETKSREDQLNEEVRSPKEYFSYFNWPTEKKGYSGVAIYTKEKPDKIEKGIGDPSFDKEGRVLVAYFKDFILLNIYFPNGGGGEERLKYKLGFYDVFFNFIEKLKKKNKKILFCGDVNTAHYPIDLARPKENENNTGFLPVERAWLDKLIKNNYVDIFRKFHPEKITYTYWDMKTFSRERNVGWRIDYFFSTKELLPSIKNISIHENILGSDHCPISIQLTL